MNPIGVIMSIIYPFLFVDPDAEASVIKTQVFKMMVSFALISGSLLVLSMLTFFENTDKNKALSGTDETILDLNGSPIVDKIPIKAQVKVLFRDKTYMGMLLSAAIVFGSFGGVGVGINLVMAVWGYDEVSQVCKQLKI
jgi:hypothetical protein